MRMPPLDHNRDSSRRERMVEHVLVGELLRHAWRAGLALDVLRPEVKGVGDEMVLECGSIVRHVQLNTSHASSKTAGVSVHVGLAERSSGCVVWTTFDDESLEITGFRFFGGAPGEPLGDLSNLRVPKHSRGNAQGVKAERPDRRVVPKGHFEAIGTIPELMDRLFGAGKSPG